MELGIHIGTFSGSSLEERLDSVVGQELEYVHLNFRVVGIEPENAGAAGGRNSSGSPSGRTRFAKADLDRVAAAIRERELKVASLSGTFNMAHPDEAHRREGLAYLEAVAAAAKPLAAPLVTLCPGSRNTDDMWGEHPENTSPAAREDLEWTLERAVRIAERYDVKLGLEPEAASVVQTAGLARQLINSFEPWLKIVFDPANLFHHEELYRLLRAPNMGTLMRGRIDSALELLGEETALAHAKEIGPDGLPGGVGVGTGKLDWRYIISGLRREGFDGVIVLHGLPEGDVEEAVDHLDQRI